MDYVIYAVVVAFVTAFLAALAWLGRLFLGAPMQAYRKLRAEIAQSLKHYSKFDHPHLIPELSHRVQGAKDVYLGQSSRLMSCATDVWPYAIWARLGLLPTLEKLREAEANLRGLSSQFGAEGEGPDNRRRREKIEQALRIKR